MQRKIAPGEIRAGMYIAGFGGRFFDHPFWRVKFLLKEKDVAKVRDSGVPYVLIDDALGVRPLPKPEALAPVVAAPPAKPRRVWAESPDNNEARRNSERARATALVGKSLRTMRGVLDDVRLGRAVRMPAVVELVDEIYETVERSPRTLLDILRLEKKDEYTYLHSVAVCTLMVNMARHLGKGDAETRDMGLAGLLHDIGKMGVPEPILNKAGRLTDAEFQSVREHPEHGYQALLQMANVPEMALDVCRHHHEKVNGTGYPFGLPGEALSLATRMGAVCDVYDALTSDRSYKEAWTPHEAIAAMWGWDGHFDRALLFAFMQSVGVFPVGMLVQLRSNRLALVLDNKRRNSRVRVCAFYATRDRAFIEPETVVIDDNLANDSIVAEADPDDWGFAGWDDMAGRLAVGQHPLPPGAEPARLAG